MSSRVEAITDEIRAAVGVEYFTPTDFAVWLNLPTRGMPGCAPRLQRDLRCIEYDDAQPRNVQEQQIARCACAYALLKMGCIVDVSPSELADSLFGTETLALELSAG